MFMFCYIWITTLSYMNLSIRDRLHQRMTEIKIPHEPLLQINNLRRDSSLHELHVRPNKNDEKLKPRTVWLISLPNENSHYHKEKLNKTTFHNEMGELKPPPSDKQIRRRIQHKPDCIAKAEWHSFNFLNCNSFHEINLASSLIVADDERDGGDVGSTSLEYMFRGGTRETWLFANKSLQAQEKVILKTLRWIKDYDEIRFDRQRIDALASERLTGSPYIVKTYGYCGMSAINEFAEGGHFGRYFASEHANLTSNDLLAFARDAALGLAHIHEIDGPEGSHDVVPTLVHHDLSPKNLLLTTDNKVKISDFNDAQLLRWNYRKNKRCEGFDWDGMCGTTLERTNRRAPEECAGNGKRYGTTERTEVHHLGSIFHFMLSKEQFPHQFKGQLTNGTLIPREPKEVKKLILDGAQPRLPPEIEESKDPAIQLIVRAMRKAFTFDAAKRPSAREIADLLNEGVLVTSR